MGFSSTEIEELKTMGDSLLAENKHGNAIKVLSDALKLATETEERSAILLSRSKAFTSMSEWLRRIPASQSEARAIMGLDPTTLAQLGLNDAKKAAQLDPSSSHAYAQEGAAHSLLEKYEEALESYMAGLAVDPLDKDLQQGLNAVQQRLAGSRPSSPAAVPQAGAKRRRVSAAEDAECSLCMKLFYEPVTTPCGHSFCRPCLLRAMDHSSKCPMCRTVLHVGREIPVTLALRQLIQKSFPEEYEARRQEEAGSPSDAGEAALPLFVMSCCLPTERMRLNIFEPRYRLMIRRCMEGSRRFGMALIGRDGQLSGTACEVEILECQPVPDGRYLLEIEGKRRCRLQRIWEQDGYRMAQAVFFTDEAPQQGSPEEEELSRVAASVLEKSNTLLAELRRSAMSSGVPNLEVLELLRRAGQQPPAADLEKLSFWVANLLPVDMQRRLQMLAMTSTLDRLQMELDLLSGYRLGGSGCTVS